MRYCKVTEKFLPSIGDAKVFCRRPGAAYSLVNLYCGALIGTLCGIRSLFKPLYGADIGKVNKSMYHDLTGRKYFSDVKSIQFEEQPATRVLTITPPCPDYSSSNPNPKGSKGDKGGAESVGP